MKFKMSVNIMIQCLALVAQLLNGLSDVVPPEKKVYLALAIMAVQGIVGILAHHSNTDGTPQTTAFVPRRKEGENPPGTTVTETRQVTTEAKDESSQNGK
jgi:hypothetical protein